MPAQWLDINITFGQWLRGKADHPFEFVDENGKSIPEIDIKAFSEDISIAEYAMLDAYSGNYHDLKIEPPERKGADFKKLVYEGYALAEEEEESEDEEKSSKKSETSHYSYKDILDDPYYQMIRAQIKRISSWKANWWKILSHLKYLTSLLYFAAAKTPKAPLLFFPWIFYTVTDTIQFISCLIFSPIPFFLTLIVKGWDESLTCFNPIRRKCAPFLNSTLENAQHDQRNYLIAGLFILGMLALIALLDFIAVKVILRGIDKQPFNTHFLDNIGGGYAEIIGKSIAQWTASAWETIVPALSMSLYRTEVGMQFFMHYFVNKAMVPAVNTIFGFAGADIGQISLETCKHVGSIFFTTLAVVLSVMAIYFIVAKKPSSETEKALIPASTKNNIPPDWSIRSPSDYHPVHTSNPKIVHHDPYKDPVLAPWIGDPQTRSRAACIRRNIKCRV